MNRHVPFTMIGLASALWTMFAYSQNESPKPWPAETRPAAQQIIGTQTFGPSYQFTDDDPIVESAREILAMGSRMIKLTARDNEPHRLDPILAMPFDTYFFWWRSSKNWYDGFSAEERAEEYQKTLAFAKRLLTDYAGQERRFFLGHWEGDWYLLPGYNPQQEVPATAVDGMVEWLNTRQQAIEDARAAVPNSLSKVYGYVEVNRVLDAMLEGKTRVVNAVVPRTTVDYVSYSSYDVQKEPQEVIATTLDYIETKLQPKPGFPHRRVFVGECGLSALAVNYDPLLHELKNREILLKFMKAGVPYILYWEMYNNEVKAGSQVGFWLIDDKGVKQPLWHTFAQLYRFQNESQLPFLNNPSLEDPLRTASIEWLESYGPLR